MSKFFEFSQNNSGGSFVFDKDRGLTHYVIIEAENADQASARAQDTGIYFNGCDEGTDCPCCGDRWYEPYGDEGTDKPEIYGQPFDKAEHMTRWMEAGHEACVHYLDGRKEWA
jgi:hypothetical protein